MGSASLALVALPSHWLCRRRGLVDQPDLVLGVDLLDAQRLNCALWWRDLFQRLKPFFLGLILGEVAVSGVWGIIYVITAEKGRWITNM